MNAPDTPDQVKALNLLTQPARDAYELPLAREAVALDMPLPGICQGFQALHLACGGQLIPDIRTGLRHRAFSEPLSAFHLIETVAGSLVEEWVGRGFTSINSRHHQGLTAEMATGGLQPTAFAPDGIVEALEDPKRPWRFGVQWRPERPEEFTLMQRDRRIFQMFVEACRRR